MNNNSEIRNPKSEIRKANVLIVDDRMENLLALEAVLASLGQNIMKASSGAEALRQALDHDFAVILMDVQMPGMDGFETASLILRRERSRHTPIIFVTASEKSEEHIFRGYGTGAVDYLFKPYTPEIVRSKVAVFVDLFRTRQSLADSEAKLRQINESLEQEVKVRTMKALRHAARTEILVQTAARLNADLAMPSLLDTLCELTAGIFKVGMTAVYLMDNDGECFRLASTLGYPEGFRERTIPLPRDIFDRYLKEYGPAALIPDIRALPDLPDQKLYAEFNICSVACVGLCRGESAIGILVAAVSGKENRWSEDDLILMKAIGDQAALAITNARLYASSRRRLEQVQALRNIDVAIVSSLDLKLTLNVVLEQVIGQLHVDAAAILLLNLHTHLLQCGANRGFRTKAIERTKLRIGEGHAGRVALERASLIVSDISAEESFLRMKLLAPEGFVFYGATPLIAKGAVRGVVEVFRRSTFDPDEEWRDFFSTLAGQVSIAIDNAILFNDLQRSNMDLSLAYDATIEGWAMALDLRDKETEGHSRRVMEMTEQIAATMNVSEPDLVHVRRGALLHDLGKLGIPDSILLKPGPLTEEEWKIMRRHPQLAFDMLSPIAYLRPALDIPYSHHEKFDGTGYPGGLKGKHIPLSARIFAVVDVWDALRSDRPYRAAMAPEEARAIIEAGTGSHFDPQVVEVFFKAMEGKRE